MPANADQEIEIRVTGTRNPASSANRVDVDGFLTTR
jgi:hypothetical protein